MKVGKYWKYKEDKIFYNPSLRDNFKEITAVKSGIILGNWDHTIPIIFHVSYSLDIRAHIFSSCELFLNEIR